MYTPLLKPWESHIKPIAMGWQDQIGEIDRLKRKSGASSFWSGNVWGEAVTACDNHEIPVSPCLTKNSDDYKGLKAAKRLQLAKNA